MTLVTGVAGTHVLLPVVEEVPDDGRSLLVSTHTVEVRRGPGYGYVSRVLQFCSGDRALMDLVSCKV